MGVKKRGRAQEELVVRMKREREREVEGSEGGRNTWEGCVDSRESEAATRKNMNSHGHIYIYT